MSNSVRKFVFLYRVIIRTVILHVLNALNTLAPVLSAINSSTLGNLRYQQFYYL